MSSQRFAVYVMIVIAILGFSQAYSNQVSQVEGAIDFVISLSLPSSSHVVLSVPSQALFSL